MFGYPFGYSRYLPSDEYAQALAEERAARNQYAAALRAQEEARNRAARARLAQQAFTSPHNSYLPDAMDDDDEDSFLSGHNFASGYGFGMSPQRRRALVGEQRRRQLMELEHERQRKALEEEESRKSMLEQQHLHEEERVSGRGLDQLYPNLDFRVSESDQPVPELRQSRSVSPTQRQPTSPVEPTASAQFSPAASPEEVAAASKIQTVYRAHALHQKALSDLASLGARFDTLRSSFHSPIKVEFRGSNSEPVLVDVSASPSTVSNLDDVTSTIPSLTYSSLNSPIHQYEEELNRLLTALDAVESGGDRKIRESRRELVKKVEKEAQRLEAWKVAVWLAGRTKHREVETNSTVPTISQPDKPSSEEIPESASLDLREASSSIELPEPEEPSLSVATAEEPFFDASSTLGPEGGDSENKDDVLIPPSSSLPETNKCGSNLERRIDGLGRPKSLLVDQGWDVLDVFDML